LEDLVARIDTPDSELRWLRIEGYMFGINIPQLHKFIVRSERLRSLNPAEILFSPYATEIILGLPSWTVNLQIVCRETNWQASSMVHVCSQLSPLLSHVERLYIHEREPGQAWQMYGIGPTQILELFVLFPSVGRLHIYSELRLFVAWALQELTGESATEVLPSLRSLFFRGPSPSGSIQKDIQGFITARQNLSHPVNVEWVESNEPPPSTRLSL
jgi:hypothetical protein